MAHDHLLRMTNSKSPDHENVTGANTLVYPGRIN